MSEEEFVEEAQYLSDLVSWLLQADESKRREEFLRYIKRQVEHMQLGLED